MIAKPHIGMLDGRWAVAPKPHPRSKMQPYTHASAWNYTKAHQWCAARNGARP